MKRKNLLIIILLVFLLLISSYGLGLSHPTVAVESKEVSNTQSAYNTLLINTYLDKLQEASNDFYDEYLTTSPTVAYYVVSVKKISSDPSTNATGFITFIVEPFVGPHDTVGTDQISFSADYTGTIELKEFKHLKSYALPDNLKSIVKKPFPSYFEKLTGYIP